MKSAPTLTNAYTRVTPHTEGKLTTILFNTVVGWSMKFLSMHKMDALKERKRLLALDQQWFHVDPRAVLAQTELRFGEQSVPTQRVSMPKVSADRVLLYLHGGAFVFRTPNAHTAMVAKWCEAWQATAYMPWYRLAPEHPYPAAINDAYTAWCALLHQGIQPKNIVLGGDSAGGNLALALLQRIKAAGGPMPSCAFFLSPAVDLTMSSESVVSNEADDPIFNVPAFLAFRRLYVHDAALLCNPDASPLFADMHGYPPLLFQCSASEMLRDDSIRAAAKAHEAGVRVSVQIWEKMPHVFQAMAQFPQSLHAHADLQAFVAEHAK